MALFSTLQIIEALHRQPATLEELMNLIGESERNVKRQITEARHLGAKIKSVRKVEGVNQWHEYTLCNKKEIDQGPFWVWLEAERIRFLGGKALTP